MTHRCRAAGGLALAVALACASSARAEPTIADLMQVAGLTDPEERIAAQDALVPTSSDSIDALVLVLSSSDTPDDLRLLALFLLGESGRDDACEAVAHAEPALGDHAAYVHASALASCGDPEAIRAIVRDAERPVAVRLKAAVAAGLRADTALLGDVTAWLDDPAFEGYHTFVYLVMGLLGDSAVDGVLAELVSQRATRDHAVIALARNGDHSRLFELRFALQNSDPLVRRAALSAASDPAYSAIHNAARQLVDDPNAAVAALARRLFEAEAAPSPPQDSNEP